MAPRRTTATKGRRLDSSTVNPPPLPTLPFDLVLEILYRVPVKPLVQFKSVCKSWKSLISDCKFTKKHFHVSTSRHHLLFRRLSKREYIINACPLSSLVTKNKWAPTPTATRKLEYPLSYRMSQESDQICGSCHGILCIQLFQSSVILWNPSTTEFTRLPSLEILSIYAIFISFGYDHSSDSYKVVGLSTKVGHGLCPIHTHVHTMGTNYWRRIHDVPCELYKESGKFVSGTLNWLAYNDSSIVSLDLETESYRELLLPDYGEVDVLSKSLWVLRDCLSILSSNRGAYSEIWLMKEYGNKDSWTKLFHVPHMGVGSCAYNRALYVYKDDQVLLEFQSKLVVYNSRDGTFKTLKIQKPHGWIFPEVYQESLISPCS